ncbi:MAG: hypothetical protein Q7K43_06455, partial [Candidatus Woesearchaeota archaeon]|nr:hypothetical protein [Candidatus Woesearchaeota archaeon]
KKTNCHRKCYYNKQQRDQCRIKFQHLDAQTHNVEFTKKEFLDFFHNQTTICVLPENEKTRFMSWNEFKTKNTKT